MNIIFKIFPASSHLNATYKLASDLRARGYNIIYTGLKDFESEVLAQGFRYFIDKDIFPPFLPSKNQTETLHHKIKKRRSLMRFHKEYLKGDIFNEIVTSLKPSLIIVDSPYVRYAIPLYSRKIPFIVFESMVALNKIPNNPPLSANIIPSYNYFSQIQIELSWWKYFINAGFKKTIRGSIFPSKSLIKTLSKKTEFPITELDFNRYFHIGLKNIPEIIASPFEFDFPHIKKNNQYYLGPSVNMDREEVSYDFRYIEMKRKIQEIHKFNKSCTATNNKVKLIYCSFGSMAWRYKGIMNFYEKLFAVAHRKHNMRFIISVGNELSFSSFKKAPSNVYLFQKVPQLELLKEVDIMITHGGMNTITECILLGVPMLVYPGTGEIDQVGNACRVHFHQIGLKGSLSKDSQYDIEGKVDKLLNTKTYKNRLSEMQTVIKSKNSLEVINLIESIMNPVD